MKMIANKKTISDKNNNNCFHHMFSSHAFLVKAFI